MVSNGRKAVDYCRSHNVDLVITDYEMPEMNGLEATKLITKEFGVPVVLDFDLGHIKPTMPLILGSYAKVDVDNNDIEVLMELK